MHSRRASSVFGSEPKKRIAEVAEFCTLSLARPYNPDVNLHPDVGYGLGVTITLVRTSSTVCTRSDSLTGARHIADVSSRLNAMPDHPCALTKAHR